MSLHEYRVGAELATTGPPPFYAVIQAAMRLADTGNAALLRAAFPEVWDELQERYNAPGGLLLDPDCRDGKCRACPGGRCEHGCHRARRCPDGGTWPPDMVEQQAQTGTDGVL
jgi:hypothetical protein